jgi:CTP:molybdopterin cytidylyltransferase MocA
VTVAEVKTVDREKFEAVMRLLADHPELNVETVRALVERPAQRRRTEKIRPSTARELVDLVGSGLLTKAEAKRYLDVPRVRRG